jgi:hypothetical protein
MKSRLAISEPLIDFLVFEKYKIEEIETIANPRMHKFYASKQNINHTNLYENIFYFYQQEKNFKCLKWNAIKMVFQKLNVRFRIKIFPYFTLNKIDSLESFSFGNNDFSENNGGSLITIELIKINK